MKLLKQVKFNLKEQHFEHLVKLTEGYSFADINALVKDAAMGPIRDL